jgi:negative regulator of sigma E activity
MRIRVFSEDLGGMQQNDELFSALLDGELAPDEIDTLIEALDREPGAADTAARWSAIGAGMRGQGSSPGSILGGVRAAIDAEPLRPCVSSLGAAREQRRMRRRWALPATGLAAAASIALAVLLLPTVMQEGAPLQPAADVAGGAVVARVADDGAVAEQSSSSSTTQTRLAAGEPAHRVREEILNTYFIEYASHRSAQGIGGPLGYARYAAHNADIPSAQPR